MNILVFQCQLAAKNILPVKGKRRFDVTFIIVIITIASSKLFASIISYQKIGYKNWNKLLL